MINDLTFLQKVVKCQLTPNHDPTSNLQLYLCPAGVLPGEAEDLWEHGPRHEAAEPSDCTRQGQTVRGRRCVLPLQSTRPQRL